MQSSAAMPIIFAGYVSLNQLGAIPDGCVIEALLVRAYS